MIQYEYEVIVTKKRTMRFSSRPSMEAFRELQNSMRATPQLDCELTSMRYLGPVDVDEQGRLLHPERSDEVCSGEPDPLPQQTEGTQNSVESKSTKRRRSLQATKSRQGKMGSGRRR